MVAFGAIVEPPLIGFAEVVTSFLSQLVSQLVSSSQASSPVSPHSAGGASGSTRSLSKPGEVYAISGPTP